MYKLKLRLAGVYVTRNINKLFFLSEWQEGVETVLVDPNRAFQSRSRYIDIII